MDKSEKTFIIVQLTRLGDLVQTYQACSEFKNQHPEIKLKLVARKDFAEALHFLLVNVFDEIITLDKSELLRNTKNLKDYTDNIQKWANQPSLNTGDVLINFSFCQTSNYLSRLIQCPNKLGTRVDQSNQTIVHDQWSQLVYSQVLTGPYFAYNLVDAYKRVLGIKESKSFSVKSLNDKNKKLAIHPFASNEKKHWKESKWGEVIFMVLKSNPELEIHLYGAKNETEGAKNILKNSVLNKYRDRIFNHVGKLSLEQTSQSLAKTTHFIGHDSLIGHLAKVNNLPTITVSLGIVRATETTPYGANSYVIAPRTKCYPCFVETDCSFYQCHADISYQAVGQVLNQFINSDNLDYEELQKNVSSFHLDSLDLFLLDQTNSGWAILGKLGEDPSIYRNIIKNIYRVAISFKFENIEEHLSMPYLTKESLIKLQNLSHSLEQYYELCEFGKKYSQYILEEVANDSPKVDKIQDYAQKVDEVDKLCELLTKTTPEIKCLVDYYKVVKFNLKGNNIVELSESSFMVYNDNSTMCQIIYELVNSILKKHSDLLDNSSKSRNKEGNA